MRELPLELLKTLIIPLIAIFTPIIFSGFEKRKMKAKYKELYFTVFAPLEKIKRESPKILAQRYISKVEQILLDDKVYGLVPVEIFDALDKMRTGGSSAVREFQRIVDNNTNELRQLQGMTYHYKEYEEKDFCVKRKSNATLILTMVMIVLVSAWMAVYVMYPEFAAKADRVMNKAKLFGLLFALSFVMSSLVAGMGFGIGRLMEQIRESEGRENKWKTIGSGFLTAGIIAAIAVLLLWGIVQGIKGYDSVDLGKSTTSQTAPSIADSSVQSKNAALKRLTER